MQNGLLVLHIWGIGFEHIDVTNAFGMNSLIKWLQSDAHLLDGLHNVGVFDNANKFDSYFKNTIANDAVYCKRIGILYLPNMFPGFSWYNLKNGASAINKIPRDGGRFMWRQAYRYPILILVTAKTSDLLLPTGGWLALDADGTHCLGLVLAFDR